MRKPYVHNYVKTKRGAQKLSRISLTTGVIGLILLGILMVLTSSKPVFQGSVELLLLTIGVAGFGGCAISCGSHAGYRDAHREVHHEMIGSIGEGLGILSFLIFIIFSLYVNFSLYV